MRDNEIELVAETEIDKIALTMLHKKSEVKIKAGGSTDTGWPPAPDKTNIILHWPDPKDTWGG